MSLRLSSRGITIVTRAGLRQRASGISPIVTEGGYLTACLIRFSRAGAVKEHLPAFIAYPALKKTCCSAGRIFAGYVAWSMLVRLVIYREGVEDLHIIEEVGLHDQCVVCNGELNRTLAVFVIIIRYEIIGGSLIIELTARRRARG